MRIVADTNVVVSALLWGGKPREIFDAARNQRVTLYTSAVLIAELEEVLARPKFAQRIASIGSAPDALVAGYRALAGFVIPLALPYPGSDDPDDDHVIAAALGARADLIVSGDRDLLDLASYDRILIATPYQAVGMLAR